MSSLKARLRFLLPHDSRVARSMLNGKSIPLRVEKVEASRYCVLDVTGRGVNAVKLALEK